MKHVLNKKHIIANDLFRRSRDFSNDIDEIYEKNIDDFIDEQLNCVHVCFMSVNEVEKKLSLKKSYSEESQRIARYLTILI